MKNIKDYFVLFVTILVVACQNPPQAIPGTAVPPLPTVPVESGPETAVPTTAHPQMQTSPVEKAEATTTFNWDDQGIYGPNLIASAQDGLNLLPHASVYSMTLSIVPEEGLVLGQQVIRYTNNEDKPLDKIYFHLFPNLLGGSIEIWNLKMNGQVVDWLYEGEMDNVMQIPLPDPLAAGEQAVITMEFVTAVPQDTGRNYGVFAQVDDVMALAHFYPLLAVYDEEGWHTDPPVEFGDPTFTDAGFYYVTLSAPSDQVVAGSGSVVGQADNGRKQSQTIVAGPARDFYLALSPNYVVETLTVGETTINSYAPAAYAAGAKQAAEVAANALKVFNQRLVPYPYTELDIVATPTLALGIEYPGIIAITQREYDPDNPLSNSIPNSVFLETTVAHEMGHQWFYNIVGNDQLEEPWLDEALAQYVTGLYYLDIYGRAAAESYQESWSDRLDTANNANTPIGLPVSTYEGAAYSAIVYGRGPLFVQALASEMGQATFDTFLQDYVVQNQWEIATTQSFQSLAEAHCQCDLNALFNEWVYAD